MLLAVFGGLRSVGQKRLFATCPYRYVKNERLPVEVLVFKMDPLHVEEFLDIDHKIWTLGEAASQSKIPFLSKEVWLDDNTPGQVKMHFIWDSREDWVRTSQPSLQKDLQNAFDSQFLHPYEVLRIDTHKSTAIHRYSRFEKV
jgi:uncharacterized protein (TIGR03792 family)